MDLASGYWQMELPPTDQEKCAMICTEGLFQPTRLPQGLSNALATFQCTIDIIFADLKISCVIVYIDEITVFLKTFNVLLAHNKEVFLRLQKTDLKPKTLKCVYFQKSTKFLGHTISESGIQLQQ